MISPDRHLAIIAKNDPNIKSLNDPNVNHDRNVKNNPNSKSAKKTLNDPSCYNCQK